METGRVMDNIIITTTPYIEGHIIKEYLGLVSYRAWTPSNMTFTGDPKDKGIDTYRDFIESAQNGLRTEAAALSANAVVGVQLLPPEGKLAATMIITGTAVIVE